jgi:hypothetical protein
MRPIDATARAIIVISTPLILFFLMNSLAAAGSDRTGRRELIPRESLAFCYLITKRPYRDGAAKLKAARSRSEML